jgi:hypothetical protein
MLVIGEGHVLLFDAVTFRTGQVLFRRLSVAFALVLPFKDSKRGG